MCQVQCVNNTGSRSHLDGRVCFCGVVALLSWDTTGRSTLAFIAETHPSCFRLLDYLHVRMAFRHKHTDTHRHTRTHTHTHYYITSIITVKHDCSVADLVTTWQKYAGLLLPWATGAGPHWWNSPGRTREIRDSKQIPYLTRTHLNHTQLLLLTPCYACFTRSAYHSHVSCAHPRSGERFFIRFGEMCHGSEWVPSDWESKQLIRDVFRFRHNP